MWFAFTILMALWFVLKFLMHKGGYVHIILIGAIAIGVVQLMVERKNRYHKAADQ
ncbi:MAG: hypothetical protein ABJC10_02845 [Acidobacteriota bacterium]